VVTPEGVLDVSPVSEADLPLLRTRSLDDVLVRNITSAGPWLDESYRLMVAEFDPDILDPQERYVRWLELNGAGRHPFPFLLLAAYLRHDRRAAIVGVLGGNVMAVEEHAGPNQSQGGPLFVFALGHQVTSSVVRRKVLRGLGSTLWQAAADEARRLISGRRGFFAFSVVEAEEDSLGYWTKLGYLWPEGVRYLQPPLEFDENGRVLRVPVAEAFLLRPMDPPCTRVVDRTLVKNIIATIYLNWSLDAYRGVLAPAAMSRVERYVMGDLYERVCRELPSTDTLPLVTPPSRVAVLPVGG